MTILQSILAALNWQARVNENFNTLSAAGIFGYKPATSTGLTWGYYGGLYNGNTIADGTLTLTNSADNYIVVLRGTGVVSVSTSNTHSIDPLYAKLYKVTCAGGLPTVVVDQRTDTNGLLFLLSGSTGGRESLAADRTYYVRSDGSDSNNGLANTSGGAFLTVQKAADTISNTLDLNGHTVTVQLADGTYTGATTLNPLVGSGKGVIKGNSGTPANVLISTTSADCFLATGAGARWTVQDCKLHTTTSGNGLHADTFAELHYGNIDFGACAGLHVYSSIESSIRCDSSYTISGAASGHFQADFGAQVLCAGKTLTITGTPAFSSAFAIATTANLYLAGNTYTGSATGTRYLATANGVINSGVTLPGNSTTAASTGGQYI